MADISELDQEAQQLRVKWTKAQNYYNSFVQDFFRIKDSFDGSRYDANAPAPTQSGQDGTWTFGLWLMFKCGMQEHTVLRRVTLFVNALAADEQERIEAEKKKRAQSNRAERAAKSQAYQAKQAERRAEKAAQAASHKPASKSTQPKAKATAKAAAARPSKPGDDAGPRLSVLTEQVRAAQEGCEVALQLETVEARRERILAYGQALLALRKAMPSDPIFGQYLIEHGLNYRTATFRSDAMWLAENYSSLMNSLKRCLYTNPIDIRNWWRGQQDKQPSKPNGKADHPTVN